jgi:imidazole glycerol phosphate synthase glutamine amidotransferase subunit
VAVLATGVANVASVVRCLTRAGASPELLRDPAEVADAPIACLPGVGSFAAGMAALGGSAPAWRDRIAGGYPTLAVCLGMQLLSEGSAESPGEPGIGAFGGRFGRLQAETVPHMGWNRVGAGAVGEGDAYFAHSYALTSAPEGWDASWADHGGWFVAALRRGPVLACQFHPELSGAYGEALVRGWLEGAC